MKQLQEVKELSVNVSAHCDGGADLQDVGLFAEDLASSEAESFDLAFFDEFALAELVDLTVEVNVGQHVWNIYAGGKGIRGLGRFLSLYAYIAAVLTGILFRCFKCRFLLGKTNGKEKFPFLNTHKCPSAFLGEFT